MNLRRSLIRRAVFVANVLAWYLSLTWMLSSDPSPLRFWALVPMLTFCLVATVSISFMIVRTLDAFVQRQAPPKVATDEGVRSS